MYFRGAAPAALTFLSVALSLQKVGHPWFKLSCLGFNVTAVLFIQVLWQERANSFKNVA